MKHALFSSLVDLSRQDKLSTMDPIGASKPSGELATICLRVAMCASYPPPVTVGAPTPVGGLYAYCSSSGSPAFRHSTGSQHDKRCAAVCTQHLAALIPPRRPPVSRQHKLIVWKRNDKV
ncbi:unnamed protein product, partial [Ectocarpus fasciculatus]